MKQITTNRSKLLTRALILLAAAGAVYVIPFNNQFTYGYGESSVLPGSTTEAPVCDSTKPAAPVLFTPSVSSGNVQLKWVKVANAQKYTVAYGTSSGNYIYGIPDVGDNDSFTVGYLNPGVRYYFAVRGVNGCTPGSWSAEQSAVAGGGSGRLAVNYQTPQDTFQPTYPTQAPYDSGFGGAPTYPQYNTPTVIQPTTAKPFISQPQPEPQLGFFARIISFLRSLFD